MTTDDKKIVIVLGAYGGIGREICRYNYVRGAKVVLVGRDQTKLLKMKGDYDAKNSIAIVGDANNIEDVRKVFTVTLEEFGGPDEVWVTIGKDGAWERDFPPDQPDYDEEKSLALWNRLYPSLLKPLEVVCPIAEEFFRKQGHGILVHLSSHVTFKGEDELPGNYTYRRLKVAAEKIVLAMRRALKDTGATAINLRPAIILTEGNMGVLNTPEKRVDAVQPEEMAKWIDKNAKNPKISEHHYFHSDVVIA